MRVSRLLVVGCLLLLLSACGSSLKKTIIGKWQSTDAGATITMDFSKDGKVTIEAKGAGGNKTASAKYRVRPDDTVEFYDIKDLTFTAPHIREAASISDKGELTLTDPGQGGKKATFKRI